MAKRARMLTSRTMIETAAPVRRGITRASKPDPELRTLVHSMLAVSDLFQTIREVFAQHLGLNGLRYEIVMAIAHLDDDGGAPIGAVAKLLQRSATLITIECAVLVRDGMIEKRPDSRDARRVLVRLTAEARRRIAALVPIQRAVNKALFASLDVAKREALTSLLNGINGDAEHVIALARDLTRPGKST